MRTAQNDDYALEIPEQEFRFCLRKKKQALCALFVVILLSCIVFKLVPSIASPNGALGLVIAVTATLLCVNLLFFYAWVLYMNATQKAVVSILKNGIMFYRFFKIETFWSWKDITIIKSSYGQHAIEFLPNNRSEWLTQFFIFFSAFLNSVNVISGYPWYLVVDASEVYESLKGIRGVNID